MLKKYYSLNEAAEFLTKEYEEEITSGDVLDIAMRGDIRLCIWHDGVLGRFKNTETLPTSLRNEPFYSFHFRGYIQIPKIAIIKNSECHHSISEFKAMAVTEVVQRLSRQCPKHLEAVKHEFYMPLIHHDFDETINVPFKVENIESIEIPALDLLDLLPNKAIPNKTIPECNPNQSDKLAILSQASYKFWANADPSDSGTHPANTMVEKFLIDKKFSPTLAKKAATIIRPEGAPKGRKPED
ncbi:MAG: hypothetical protein DHS20C13_24090 [Thermodesulfobacteriota bacterium]|nr:MAG: hypothetical protein DHS20C13_24090 [Thermodesulfobacteriota bacterium]